jgi:hypothetical protein
MAIDKAAILLAVHEIAAHPAVRDLGDPVFGEAGAHVTFGLELDFGSRWAAEHVSPTGVLPVEVVRFDFGPGFPSTAARPSLRPDFSRDHPHIQPWLGPDNRVVPCLVDGALDEFAAAHGYYRLIDQFVKWLRSAAEERLIDPAQGWEPMRRDDFTDTLICDAAQFRGFVGRDAGFKFVRTSYMWKRTSPQDVGVYFGEAGEPTTATKLDTLESSLTDDGWGVGVGVALVVWAGRAPGGGPVVCDKYVPDNIGDLNALLARAAELRMGDPLQAGLTLVRRYAKSKKTPETIPVPVVLMVRRPVKVIGTDSDIELCPYVVPVTPGGQADANPPVSPLGHNHAISVALLRRMSGDAEGETWALLGCGSLGSKIAMHRARSGAAPTACADKSSLRAHNTARHALYPRKRLLQSDWSGAKATELAAAIKGLGQTTTPVEGTHRKLIGLFGKEGSPTPTWLLNTTASTVVREDLASTVAASMPRVVEACLFDAGKLGYMSTEGQGRNPDTAELLGELYEQARDKPDVGRHLFAGAGDVGSVSIGQGCASMTMVMGDAQISAVAAPMSQILAGLSSDHGAGRIDLLVHDGLNTTHQAVDVAPCRRVALEGMDGWAVSLSERAHDAITTEVAAHPATETGGVLVGWVSMITRRIYVTSIVEAPPDSVRSASEFVLGTQGLHEALVRLWKDTAGAVVCVGTWHSHLGAATPSVRDKISAAVVGLMEPRPMAFLIHGADGLRAISAAAPMRAPAAPVVA